MEGGRARNVQHKAEVELVPRGEIRGGSQGKLRAACHSLSWVAQARVDGANFVNEVLLDTASGRKHKKCNSISGRSEDQFSVARK